MIELFKLILFNGFWIFLGSIIILGILTDFIVNIFKALLRPFRCDKHYHFNNKDVDIEEFTEWVKEKEDEV